MKKISCLIIDDEPMAREGLKEYVREVEFIELAGVCHSALEAAKILTEKNIDLLLLDIEMPLMSGIEFLKTLKRRPAVILTTAYPDYAITGFDLDVIDYLLKPFGFPRFLKAVNKAAEFVHATKEAVPAAAEADYFFIKVNSKFEKILYEEVLFVEALQNYIAVHLANKKMLSYMPISTLEKQLPSSQFMRIHKSYIVSLSKINSIEGNKVTILTHQLPLSRRLKDQLQKVVFEKRLLKR